jgi:xylose isomerase
MKEPTFSADFAMFGTDPSGFGPQGVGTLEAIDRAGEVGDLTGFDLAYPFLSDVTVDEIKAALARNNLRASVVHPALYTDEFKEGGFTNPDPVLRKRATEVVRETAELAEELGADYVKIWPGRDGHDYPFQVDHAALWDRALEGVAEVARANPGTRFAIEYKRKEPRTHLLFGNASRLLLGLEEIGLDNLGIVVDFGHSLFAYEAPADALHLANRYGRLFGVEFNDNYRASDDDLTAGSVHLMETIEFVHAMRQIDYEGVWELDQTGVREDPVPAARASVRTLRGINRLLDGLDESALAEAQAHHDSMEAQRLIHSLLLSEVAPQVETHGKG